jgi:hypothetical protein
MSKVLMVLIALLAGAFVAAFYFLTQNPMILAWGAVVGVLTFLGGVQWTVYTSMSDPAKLARLVAKYLPVAEIEALTSAGKDSFSSAVAEAALVLGKLKR